ncbi:hypothetical protein J5N97_016312 [Dioscorea zingiberensis]|uniref:Thioredoxin domain-containing protein n=1 Tax=Dioscorea zingiberensis TaxID=325984 RepID=A0A9D5CJM1_9LILI|nr:hypothetical protein J5N97_016312 [Dioscorea zingiberensis]
MHTPKFQRFESFFTKFTTTAREYFLPPERQRYGLVTETSLLPFLGVSDPETWFAMLQFPLCPNCSKMIREIDDLHAVLQMHDSVVTELDVDGQNSQLAFPADRPSIILFVDRSSSSSEIEGASKSALESLKQFARDCHLSMRANNNSKASLVHVISGTWHKNTRDLSSQIKSKVSPLNKLVKIKDDMTIMIMNEGENTSLDDISSQAQGSQFYDVLAELLHRREPAVKTKETKISLLAKEVGFQLLSDDFEVQVVDKLPSNTEHTQLDKITKNDASSLMDQTSKHPRQSTEQSSNLSGSIAMNDGETPELFYTETDLQQNQEAAPSRESSTSITGKEHRTEQEGSESFTHSADNSFHVIHKSPLVEEYTDNEYVDNSVFSLSKVSSTGFAENLVHESSEMVSAEEDSSAHVKGSAEMVRSGEQHVLHQSFLGSFCFSDGNHQFLGAMTASSKIPSLIILDPILQQHYVLSEKENITYSSISDFIGQFLNGSLTPYQKSESHLAISRQTPRPPFVNLDFHEADSIPRLTANTFCELVVGLEHCATKSKMPSSNTENTRPAYNVDVLVLFSTSWCGFCQRMELIVREVYRSLKGFSILLKNESLRRNSMNIQEKNEGALIGLPFIYLLDCTLNDCGSFLIPLGKEERYPTLLLFPAGNKEAISYEGYLSVGSIIEFLISHGTNSHHLNKHEGLLWTHRPKSGKNSHIVGDAPSPLEDNFNEIIINDPASRDNEYSAVSHMSDNLSYDHHVFPGSVLTATDKLLNSFPFNNSTILIVTADKDQGFQGLIINKRMSWNVFKEFSRELDSIKLAPLSYGGPVVVDGLPLVSLVRNPRVGYTAVHAGLYFGNAVATSLSIKEIKSEKQSASDYWFFLGYSSWGWNQLFDELAEGAWHLSDSPIASLDWPYS